MPTIKTKDGIDIFYEDWGQRTAKGTLKTYKSFSHGMITTEAETINAVKLAFMRS